MNSAIHLLDLRLQCLSVSFIVIHARNKADCYSDPAVYYAHLASVRALPQHNIPTDRMPIDNPREPRIGDEDGEYDLIPICDESGLSKLMWFI